MSPLEFEEIVLAAFRYLIEDYGFNYSSTSVHAPDVWSAFHNRTTAVTVHFELGSLPWVELAQVKWHAGQLVEQNRAGLEFLVQERAPREPQPRFNPGSDDDVRAALELKARQLRTYGRDVLKGDFRVFPRLRELAEENLRRREATE